MEPKKNPKYDVHAKRGTIFNLSLAISFIVVIIAFKWAVPITEQHTPSRKTLKEVDLLFTPVEITRHEQQERRPPETKVMKTTLPTARLIAVLHEPTEASPAPAVDQLEPAEPLPIVTVDDLPREKPVDSVFKVVEKMPMPVGGYEKFYSILQDNMKYPGPARRTGVEGKVLVAFTVDQRGELSDFEVLRGIGAGCNEEAIRVLRLTQWQPGKQRGIPVSVRMVQPIYFSLGK